MVEQTQGTIPSSAEQVQPGTALDMLANLPPTPTSIAADDISLHALSFDDATLREANVLNPDLELQRQEREAQRKKIFQKLKQDADEFLKKPLDEIAAEIRKVDVRQLTATSGNDGELHLPTATTSLTLPDPRITGTSASPLSKLRISSAGQVLLEKLDELFPKHEEEARRKRFMELAKATADTAQNSGIHSKKKSSSKTTGSKITAAGGNQHADKDAKDLQKDEQPELLKQYEEERKQHFLRVKPTPGFFFEETTDEKLRRRLGKVYSKNRYRKGKESSISKTTSKTSNKNDEDFGDVSDAEVRSGGEEEVKPPGISKPRKEFEIDCPSVGKITGLSKFARIILDRIRLRTEKESLAGFSLVRTVNINPEINTTTSRVVTPRTAVGGTTAGSTTPMMNINPATAKYKLHHSQLGEVDSYEKRRQLFSIDEENGDEQAGTTTSNAMNVNTNPYMTGVRTYARILELHKEARTSQRGFGGMASAVSSKNSVASSAQNSKNTSGHHEAKPAGSGAGGVTAAAPGGAVASTTTVNPEIKRPVPPAISTTAASTTGNKETETTIRTPSSSEQVTSTNANGAASKHASAVVPTTTLSTSNGSAAITTKPLSKLQQRKLISSSASSFSPTSADGTTTAAGSGTSKTFSAPPQGTTSLRKDACAASTIRAQDAPGVLDESKSEEASVAEDSSMISPLGAVAYTTANAVSVSAVAGAANSAEIMSRVDNKTATTARTSQAGTTPQQTTPNPFIGSNLANSRPRLTGSILAPASSSTSMPSQISQFHSTKNRVEQHDVTLTSPVDNNPSSVNIGSSGAGNKNNSSAFYSGESGKTNKSSAPSPVESNPTPGSFYHVGSGNGKTSEGGGALWISTPTDDVSGAGEQVDVLGRRTGATPVEQARAVVFPGAAGDAAGIASAERGQDEQPPAEIQEPAALTSAAAAQHGKERPAMAISVPERFLPTSNNSMGRMQFGAGSLLQQNVDANQILAAGSSASSSVVAPLSSATSTGGATPSSTSGRPNYRTPNTTTGPQPFSFSMQPRTSAGSSTTSNANSPSSSQKPSISSSFADNLNGAAGGAASSGSSSTNAALLNNSNLLQQTQTSQRQTQMQFLTQTPSHALTLNNAARMNVVELTTPTPKNSVTSNTGSNNAGSSNAGVAQQGQSQNLFEQQQNLALNSGRGSGGNHLSGGFFGQQQHLQRNFGMPMAQFANPQQQQQQLHEEQLMMEQRYGVESPNPPAPALVPSGAIYGQQPPPAAAAAAGSLLPQRNRTLAGFKLSGDIDLKGFIAEEAQKEQHRLHPFRNVQPQLTMPVMPKLGGAGAGAAGNMQQPHGGGGGGGNVSN
ncbi:unnamed protein product [Amoebophrya sp. A120]|nr:unnamed protein product [Amoebophrya sp. A120]|eukprot:GSA120T00015906001.1